MTNPTEKSILVTGICGRFGKLVARRLHRTSRVIGIDRRPFEGKPKDIVHYQFDIRRKRTRDIFRSGAVQAVVHLGIMHDLRKSAEDHHSFNVVAFQKVLEYMAQYGVRKLVLLSSANVYGPSPENPQFLNEDAPLLGAARFTDIRDLVEVDMLAQSFFWRRPEIETVILRPCHILGRVANAPSNYLRLDRPVKLLGFDPMIQVIHEDDVAKAVELALTPGVRGVFNLRGPGEVSLSRALAVLGKDPLEIPLFAVKRVLQSLWNRKLVSFPPEEIDHIRYLCMVDDERARKELCFRPSYDLEATLRSVVR